jgi:hypothetical protein
MGKNAARITALGIAAAVPVLSAAIALPGTAAADPSPTVGGDCPATLQNGKAGQGLTVDAGAPLNAPNRLTVGLDSKSKQTDGQNNLLNLPVGDVVRTLGVGEVPIVGDAASNTVCPLVQGAANGVGNTTQGLIGGVQGTPPGGGNPPGPGKPGPGQPGPGQPGPGNPNPGGSSLDPVATGPGDVLSGLDTISGVFTNAAMLPASFVQAPVITQVIPGKVPDQPPTVDEKKSGSAQALPAVTPPARLPMLIAVLALAVVAAALVRAWLRRKPA